MVTGSCSALPQPLDRAGRAGPSATTLSTAAPGIPGRATYATGRDPCPAAPPPASALLSADQRRSVLHDTLEPMLGGYSTKLIGWVEVAPDGA